MVYLRSTAWAGAPAALPGCSWPCWAGCSPGWRRVRSWSGCTGRSWPDCRSWSPRRPTLPWPPCRSHRSSGRSNPSYTWRSAGATPVCRHDELNSESSGAELPFILADTLNADSCSVSPSPRVSKDQLARFTKTPDGCGLPHSRAAVCFTVNNPDVFSLHFHSPSALSAGFLCVSVLSLFPRRTAARSALAAPFDRLRLARCL